MKALTVRQPWAWAVARGHKPIENRIWTTPYRGPLLIHAGKRWDDGGLDALRRLVHLCRDDGAALPKSLADDLPYSGVGLLLATVHLVDICTASLLGVACDCGSWSIPGRAHWRLANPRPLTQVRAATGRLGLWEVTAR